MVAYKEKSGGITNFIPPINRKILPQSEYNDQLAKNLAEYNKMSIEETKEYMKYG